ncbi:MAG: alpha/beta fold hydrolase, partial [Halobacteria archaeon]|nr:alpha/beta fold hydrolase [Halobacteria archaeon]
MAEKERGEREKEHRRTEIETHDLKFEALEVGDGDDYALLFHGFPDDPRSFLPLMERLAEEGYTAVAPYMRGYGGTDRPPLTPSNYSVTKLGSDVLAVSSALGADDPLILGHDWGATAVTAVSRLDPTSASNCVTMSVPPDILSAFDEHPSQTLRSWYMALFQIPGVSEEVLRRDDFAMVERLYRMWSPGWTDGRV